MHLTWNLTWTLSPNGLGNPVLKTFRSMGRKRVPGSAGPRCHQPRYQWALWNTLPSHGREEFRFWGKTKFWGKAGFPQKSTLPGFRRGVKFRGSGSRGMTPFLGGRCNFSDFFVFAGESSRKGIGASDRRASGARAHAHRIARCVSDGRGVKKRRRNFVPSVVHGTLSSALY